MKQPWEWEEDDVEILIKDKVKENLSLEYKRSLSLNKNDQKSITELSKDISAFANSVGGTIIFGVEEDNKTQTPIKIDGGFKPDEISGDWLDQIISSNIQPKLKVRIKPIALSKTNPGSFIYVVYVPLSETAPHMASDKRYYYRRETRKEIMEDFQVRDVLNRKTTPDLLIYLKPILDSANKLNFQIDNTYGTNIEIAIKNNSNTPAFYYCVELLLDERLRAVFTRGTYKGRMSYVINKRQYKTNVFEFIFGIPSYLPVWKGKDFCIDKMALSFSEQFTSDEFFFHWWISSPGMESREGNGFLKIEGEYLFSRPLDDEGKEISE
jgi:hypothetical protein